MDVRHLARVQYHPACFVVYFCVHVVWLSIILEHLVTSRWSLVIDHHHLTLHVSIMKAMRSELCCVSVFLLGDTDRSNCACVYVHNVLVSWDQSTL